MTWINGRHTLKFGLDIRRMRAGSDLGFIGGDNYGNFGFDGTFSGVPMGDFLLGLPVETAFAIVKNDNDGRTTHYAYYAQDSFRVSPRLTLEFGLRYEYHPSYRDSGGNIGNFDPSVAKSGRVVFPTGTEANLAPGYLQSFNACPEIGSTEGPSANGAPCTPGDVGQPGRHSRRSALCAEAALSAPRRFCLPAVRGRQNRGARRIRRLQRHRARQRVLLADRHAAVGRAAVPQSRCERQADFRLAEHQRRRQRHLRPRISATPTSEPPTPFTSKIPTRSNGTCRSTATWAAARGCGFPISGSVRCRWSGRRT